MNNTLFIILINIFCFLEKDYFSRFLGQYKLFAPYLIFEEKQIIRLFSSNLFHNNFYYLFANLIRFLFISNKIEEIFKKKYMLIFFSTAILSNIIIIIISLVEIYLFENNSIYYLHSLGLSNIIFALRAIYFKRLNRNVLIFGFIIHSSYIIWIDLFIEQIMLPSSFLISHVSGITSGLLINNYL